MFYILDTQCYNYVCGGEEFKTLKEACQSRIDYHEIDTNMTNEKKLLKQGKIKECWHELEFYDWRLCFVGKGEEIEEVDIDTLPDNLIN